MDADPGCVLVLHSRIPSLHLKQVILHTIGLLLRIGCIVHHNVITLNVHAHSFERVVEGYHYLIVSCVSMIYLEEQGLTEFFIGDIMPKRHCAHHAKVVS